jgi:hypothetical protein
MLSQSMRLIEAKPFGHRRKKSIAHAITLLSGVVYGNHLNTTWIEFLTDSKTLGQVRDAGTSDGSQEHCWLAYAFLQHNFG